MEEKIKILFVVHNLAIGGVQKSLIALLNEIDYDLFDVTVVLLQNKTDLLPEVNEKVKLIINTDNHHYYLYPQNLINLCICRIGQLFGSSTERYNRLRDNIRHQKFKFISNNYSLANTYDISVSYMQGYPAEFVAQYIHANKKIVFYHGSEDEHHNLHEKIFNQYDKIIGCSKIVSEQIIKYYPNYSSKITYLNNYVNTNKILQLANKEPLLRSDDFSICTCTRVSKDKSIDRIIETAKILNDRGKSFIWYIIGDGPSRTEVENLIDSYGLNDKVIITGYKLNPFPYYMISDVFVLCTDDEGLPMSMLEALALNLPILSTKTAGGLYLVKDGWNGTFSDFSSESVAERLIFLMDNVEILKKYKSNIMSIDHDEIKKAYQKNLIEILS